MFQPMKLKAFNLKAVEKELIHKCLIMNDGNISASCDDLGLSRATLYRKIKTHKINLDKLRKRNLAV